MFLTEKYTAIKVKWQKTKWGKKFAKCTTDTEILFLIYFKTVKIKGEMTKLQKNNALKAQANNL